MADTGIGIPEDRLASLFESFSQVDASTTRVYGGTGLGLAISQRLVEAMGGVLAVKSVSGTGSTFLFSVAFGTAPHTPETTAVRRSATLDGRAAPVVDDNPTNLRILQLQLEGWGMRVTVADSGDAAMALVNGDERFDIAVLDMTMPGMTGVQLAQRLRGCPSTGLVPSSCSAVAGIELRSNPMTCFPQY